MANAFNIDKGGSTTSDTHLINETFHVFSKSPGSPTTSLGGARLKSGHTTTTSDVWADEIPAFFKAATQAKFDLFSTKAVKDDLCLFNGNVYQHNGTEFVSLGTEAEVLVDGATFKKNDKDVIKFHKGRTAINLTADNNNGDGSNNYTAKIYDAATGSTTFVPQFISAMDKMVDGIPSLAYDAAVFAGGSQLAEGLTADNDYICNAYAGVIQFNKARSSGVTVNAWEYIGDKLTTSISSIRQSIKDISDVTLKGVVASVTADENTAQKAGIIVDNTVSTTPVIKFTGGSVTTDETKLVSGGAVKTYVDTTALSEGGSIAKAIADAKGEVMNAINAIQHFNVKVVDALPESAAELVENTIYLVPEEDKTSGNYVEYIAYKPEGSETVTTERIGTTAVDLEGYTTDEEYAALAGETGRVTVLEGKVTTLTGSGEGSVAKALADAKTYAEEKASAAKSGAETTAANALAEARTEITAEIAQAKSEAIASAEVTITAGTGIVVTGEGKGTTFEIAVSDDVATSAALTALSETVASNKTELEGKITAAETAASTALETAKTEIKGTTDALDSRLTDAEAGIEALTNGDNSVAKQIETAATAIKGQSLAQTGTLSGMFTVQTEGTVGTGITAINISDTGLAQAIADAKSGAEQTAATNLATARGEITTEISDAVSGLETKLTTGEDSLGGKVAALESSVKDITDTTIPAAITTAKDGAVATVKALTLSATDSDDAGKVTVTLGGTVETPTITVTSSDIASAQTLSDLANTVNTHIAEAAGLYLSVEKVDTLPADDEAKTNKIYLVPVDTEAGRENNIHTEYIWTNNKWEIIGTTAIDINSLEASAKAAQDAADKAQGEVDAVEEAIAAMDADLTVNGISVKQVDGTITELSESLITASVPAGTTSVEGNVAYVGSEKHVIAPDKFQTAAQMPATLTSWVADLSNLTNGDNMFNGCTGLTVFVGDLSSLTSGVDMFNGCTLDSDSLEILAENLPTVSGGTIDIGASTNATEEVIATIKGKGWTVKSNGTDL